MLRSEEAVTFQRERDVVFVFSPVVNINRYVFICLYDTLRSARFCKYKYEATKKKKTYKSI